MIPPEDTKRVALLRNPDFNRSLLVRFGRRVRPWVNRVLVRSSLLPNQPVMASSLFPWLGALEAEWQAIRDEAAALLRHRHAIPPLGEISPDHARIAVDDSWQTFFFQGYGYRVEENRARAPRTAAAIDRIPGVNSALFSILAPGAHIPRHNGVSKAQLTLHLALVVPKDWQHCRMDVEGQTLHWQAGKAFVFDDADFHEVWNDTDETRVILLVQFARPMRWPGRLVAGAFLAGVKRSTFVQDARHSIDKWEAALVRAERALGES